ncbi:MAG: response regulator RpfG family c-di-GMP phosphodiesterase [Chlamydiales bacterium]|jgi:response regulator RpfG family c-di-GMP phosphodiesterase
MLSEESRKDVKVLMVDDEERVLAGYKRHLQKLYQLTTTTNPREGIDICKKEGPFAVVVSDQRMPEMDGVTFLTEIRQSNPDSVRIMLSGQADMEETINAVNEGNIFRFLNKPCRVQDLVIALDAGIIQYKLLESEKVLLDKTLRISLEVLVEVLSLVNPYAHGCASRLYRIVKRLAMAMEYEKSWELEIATLLSHIGMVTIPEGILTKIAKGRELTEQERDIYLGHTDAGYNLIKSIPRLEIVCSFVQNLYKVYDPVEYEALKGTEGEVVALGEHILNLALDFDKEVFGKKQTEAAALLGILKRAETGKYNPVVVESLKAMVVPSSKPKELSHVRDFTDRMTTAKPVFGNLGNEVLPANYAINQVVLKLLENLDKSGGIAYPIYVWADETKYLD